MSLKHHLDQFIENFPKEKHLSSDPVQFVHRYDQPLDREVVGLIASVFAYGNVKSVLRTVESALSYLGPSPAQTIASFDPRKDIRRVRGFYHRFNTSRDLAILFWIIRRALEDYGSLESSFASALRAFPSLLLEKIPLLALSVISSVITSKIVSARSMAVSTVSAKVGQVSTTT